MKKRLLLVLLLVPTLGLAAPEPPDPTPEELVDQLFSSWDNTRSPGCTLGVIREGKMILGRGYGMANLEHGLALTTRSVFRIASTSKQFTAAAVALLAEEGKLSLDDDVRKHLPEMRYYQKPVTIRHLLHHTSGIRDYLVLMYFKGRGSDADYYTVREVLETIARQENLNFEPGQGHLYSNSGYFLLSQIVERASGKSLREYAHERIFEPLDMDQTHFHDDHTGLVPNRASGYRPSDSGGYRISATTLDMVGDGGVFTSVEDLFKWDQNFYQNRLGSGSLIEQLTQRGRLNDGQSLDYALGLNVRKYKGLDLVSHGGSFVGYRAEMIRFPRQRFSVICLCNAANINPSRLALQVADIYLADEYESPAEPPSQPGDAESAVVALPAGNVEQWAGLYFSSKDKLVREIRLVEGGLVYSRGAGNENPLEQVAPNRFRMLEVPASFILEFSPGQMKAVIEGEGSVFFEKVQPSSSADLARFAGRYYSPELDVDYELSLEEGELKASIERRETFELQPRFEGVFTVEGARDVFEFQVDERGQVTGFLLSAGRVRDIRFLRK